MNRWEIEKKIVMKALKDPAFRKKLMEQPNAAVRSYLEDEEKFDMTGFETIQVRIVEEKKEEWVLALPSPMEEMGSLSEAEIEKLYASGPQVFADASHEWKAREKGPERS